MVSPGGGYDWGGGGWGRKGNAVGDVGPLRLALVVWREVGGAGADFRLGLDAGRGTVTSSNWSSHTHSGRE